MAPRDAKKGLGERVMYQVAGPKVRKLTSQFPRTPLAELREMSLAGDETVDAYLSNTDLNPKRDDVLDKLRADVGRGHPQARVLWNEINTIPSWVEPERVKRGQEVFYRFAEMFNVLFLFDSLIGTGSPDFSKVFLATGYLANPSKQSFTRLVETIHWVVNIMADKRLGPGSESWEATIRVRFLHAAVRQRLKEKWTSEEVVIPINQEQNCATLLAICVQPFMQFPALGLRVTKEEREDFGHAWRYIGYLMGIPDKWNPLRNGVDWAISFYTDVVSHLLSPDDHAVRVSNAVLGGAAIGLSDMIEKLRPTFIYSQRPNRKKARVESLRPFFFKILTHLARIVNGDEFCDFVGFPENHEISFVHKIIAKVLFSGLVMETRILRLTPLTRGPAARVRKEFYTRIYTWYLGDKPSFRLKHDPAESITPPVVVVEE